MFSINSPFTSKELPDGRLFTRVHGLDPVVIDDNTTHIFEFTIPYTHCKMTCAEIIADVTHTTSFEVHHPQAGKLNQFGYDVCMGLQIYKRESSYDADVFQGLILKIPVTNKSGVSKKFGVNIVLHEVVA
jgi:hypothetical protein